MRALAPLLLAALVLGGCAGPKPEIVSAEATRPDQGKSDVTVVVRHRGGGDGQIEVRVTLLDAEGRVVGREERTTGLRERETLTLLVEVRVPEGTGDVRVEAEAVYPPD